MHVYLFIWNRKSYSAGALLIIVDHSYLTALIKSDKSRSD